MAITSLGSIAREIDYTKLRQRAVSQGAAYYGEVHHSPQPFRPTGQGLGVTTPDRVADQGNANAVMLNYGVARNAPAELARVYLWVENIQTGYSVSGSYSQAHQSKTWYPRNFQQDLVTITGWVANQNEYDNLVRFVQHSHHTALTSSADNWFRFIDFKLFRPLKQKHTFFHVPKGGIHYGLLATDIDGGHERFQFAREFQLTCKVTNDFQDNKQQSLYESTAANIDYVQIWGDPSLPTPVVVGTTPVKFKPKSLSTAGQATSAPDPFSNAGVFDPAFGIGALTGK